MELYFACYDIPREEQVTTTCYYLDDNTSKWWRWVKVIYDKEGKHLGWTAFKKEFMRQCKPHCLLANLKHEDKLKTYIEEFWLLQTMVRGWSEEAL